MCDSQVLAGGYSLSQLPLDKTEGMLWTPSATGLDAGLAHCVEQACGRSTPRLEFDPQPFATCLLLCLPLLSCQFFTVPINKVKKKFTGLTQRDREPFTLTFMPTGI